MSNDRLTDGQVADLAAIFNVEVIGQLAREVQEYRALRPDCPTCENVPCDGSTACPAKRHRLGCFRSTINSPDRHPCPDCPDGKMPLDKWVALLINTLHTVRADQIAHLPSVLVGAKPHSSPADAVLKMVSK